MADAYLFTVTNWGQYVGVDISGFAHLSAYRAWVGARPAVVAAMKAEGFSNKPFAARWLARMRRCVRRQLCRYGSFG